MNKKDLEKIKKHIRLEYMLELESNYEQCLYPFCDGPHQYYRVFLEIKRIEKVEEIK